MTLSGRHSEVRAGVGLDPMLLGGCNHLGPRVGPPLLKLVPCLPVDSKPFLAAVGGHPFWGHTFHPPSSDVLALLAWGLGLPRTQRSVWWEWAEACKPLWSAGKDTGRLCLPSQHHGQRRPPTPPTPPRWLPSLGVDPCVGAMGVGWGRGRWVWTCRKRGAGQGWVAGQPASSRRLRGVGVW